MQKQINQLIHLPFWPKMGWVIFFAIFGTFSLTTTGIEERNWDLSVLNQRSILPHPSGL